MHTLGVCFEKGNGVAKDTAEATKLYKLAADQCYAAAQYSLGGHVLNVLYPSLSVSIFYFCFFEQFCCAGVFYEKGIGVTIDEAEAVRLYKLAADQDYCDAQYNLGNKRIYILIDYKALGAFNLISFFGCPAFRCVLYKRHRSV